MKTEVWGRAGGFGRALPTLFLPGAVSVGGGFPRVLPAHRAVLGACRPATIGLESMQKQSSTIHLRAILWRMRWQSGTVGLCRSLYCHRNMRWGILRRYSFSLENNRNSLSMPMASAAMPRATTSGSENRGTTPGRGMFPCSLNHPPAFCLQMSRNFANIACKLCVR